MKIKLPLRSFIKIKTLGIIGAEMYMPGKLTFNYTVHCFGGKCLHTFDVLAKISQKVHGMYSINILIE